jgi:hypothetical protein
MTPTNRQVECTLAALQSAPARSRLNTAIAPLRLAANNSGLDQLPEGLLERLALLEPETPGRHDFLVKVSDRLEHGDRPTSDQLANRIVARMVCDRLR